MYMFTSLTRGTGNNISHSENVAMANGRSRALVPTEPGAHSLRVIVYGAANKAPRNPHGTAFISRPLSWTLGSSRCRCVVSLNAGRYIDCPLPFGVTFKPSSTRNSVSGDFEDTSERGGGEGREEKKNQGERK